MIEYITRYCKKPEMLWEVAHVFVGVKEIGGVTYLVLECVVFDNCRFAGTLYSWQVFIDIAHLGSFFQPAVIVHPILNVFLLFIRQRIESIQFLLK